MPLSSPNYASSEVLRSLRALPMTETELKLMAAAANIGLSRMPKKGYRTPAATGTPSALYTKAKNRFCLMFFIVALESSLAPHDTAKISLDQRYSGAFHGDIRARAHGDAHMGLRQSRGVIDAVSGHGHESAFVLQPLDRPRLSGRAALRQ